MKNAVLNSVELSCQKARFSTLFPFPSGDFSMKPSIELSNGIINNVRGGLPLTTASGASLGSIGAFGATVDNDMLDFILENYW